MGTRVAPTLVNMFMGDFECKHVYTYRLQPLIWARFIDDIFLLWTNGTGTIHPTPELGPPEHHIHV